MQSRSASISHALLLSCAKLPAAYGERSYELLSRLYSRIHGARGRVLSCDVGLPRWKENSDLIRSSSGDLTAVEKEGRPLRLM